MQFFNYILLGFLVVCAIPGALIGSYLARVLDAGLLRKLFGGMLVVTGLPSLLSRRRGTAAQEG